jgi:hypothetical protein
LIQSPTANRAALSFTGPAFKARETGCDIDWHLVDRATAEVSLDDYVYALNEQ